MILCLPDDAAREAVALIENDAVKVIDASTAYRVAPDWAYGFAEMSKDQRAKIATCEAHLQSGLLSDWLHRADAAAGGSGRYSARLGAAR